MLPSVALMLQQKKKEYVTRSENLALVQARLGAHSFIIFGKKKKIHMVVWLSLVEKPQLNAMIVYYTFY